MIAEEINTDATGLFKDFSFSEDELDELYVAGWLHDCGKVATPTHVVDKGTKLETIFDRIETINTRFEVLKRDVKIDYLQKMLNVKPSSEKAIKALENEYKSKLRKIRKDQMFIQGCNIGGEYMAKELQERVIKISNYPYRQNGKKQSFLSKEEVRNLNIPKGTLLPEERQIINDHIVITIDMLNDDPNKKAEADKALLKELLEGTRKKKNRTFYEDRLDALRKSASKARAELERDRVKKEKESTQAAQQSQEAVAPVPEAPKDDELQVVSSSGPWAEAKPASGSAEDAALSLIHI